MNGQEDTELQEKTKATENRFDFSQPIQTPFGSFGGNMLAPNPDFQRQAPELTSGIYQTLRATYPAVQEVLNVPSYLAESGAEKLGAGPRLTRGVGIAAALLTPIPGAGEESFIQELSKLKNIFHPELGNIGMFLGKAGRGEAKGYGLTKIASDHPDVIQSIPSELPKAKVVEKLPGRTILESTGAKPIRFIVDHRLGDENKTFLNNAYFKNKVPREGVEPPTQGASNLRSTVELPRPISNVTEQGQEVEPQVIHTPFSNQAMKGLETSKGGSIPRTPVPGKGEITPSSPLPQAVTQNFKYVKNEPIDIAVGENDVKTARGIREQFTGVKNEQIVRGNQLAQEIRRQVPDKLERQGMFWYKAARGNLEEIENAIADPKFKEVKPQLERALHLSDNAKQALQKGEQYYQEAGLVSQENNVIRNLRENYQNRIYTPEPPKDFVRSEMGKGVSTYTSHAKQRVFDNELEAVRAGKQFATTDFADALSIHNEEMTRVNTAAKLYDALPDSGIAAKVPIGQIPQGWKKVEGFKQYPQTEEVVAPQGIADGLRAITDPDFAKRIDTVRNLMKYQGLVKTVDLAYSFFHHFTMAMQTIYQGVGRDILKLPVMNKLLSKPEFGKLEQDFVRHTGITSNVQVNQDIMRDLTRKNPDFFSKITNLPVVKQALDIADKNTDFLFGKMQRMFKVTDYGRKVSNWVGKHPGATDAEIRTAKTSFAREVNNAYGGLNWEAMGITKSNLSILRTLLLAPDWTISNIALVKQAFEKGAGGGAARRSLLGGILKGMVLTEFFNKQLTGHFTDQNPKGHGLEVEVAPNVYVSFLRGGLGDLVKWSSMLAEGGPIAGTARFLQGKLAPFPRTAVGVFSGTKYTGQPIAGRKQGPVGKTVNYLEYLGQSAGPVPFGLSNVLGSQTSLLGKAFIGTGIGRYSAPKKSHSENRFNF